MCGKKTYTNLTSFDINDLETNSEWKKNWHLRDTSTLIQNDNLYVDSQKSHKSKNKTRWHLTFA